MDQDYSIPQGMDAGAVNLARAIRQQESGGDYNKSGDAGTSAGAYQWNNGAKPLQSGQVPVNFQNDAKQYGLDPNDFSPKNQDMVAYHKILSYKQQGLNVPMIAAAWNSGDPKNYQNHSGDVVINGKPIHYDTPAYAQNVNNLYQSYKEKSGTSNDQPTPDTTGDQVSTDHIDTYGAIAPASPTDNPLVAGGKALINVPSSLLNLGKSLFSAVTHPIHTIKGIGNAFAGGIEEGYHALTGTPASDNTQTETFDALKKSFVDRYGSLENAQRTATNDPVGFGADVFSILEGGAGLVKATTGLDAVGALDRGVSAVASPVVSAGEKVVDLAGTGSSKVLGQTTGVGSDSIKTGYQAGVEGGSAQDNFLAGLRGNKTPEDLATQARGALDEVVQQRSDNYKEMLDSLKEDTSKIDITPLKNQLDTTLEDFNIKKDAGGKLNFDESTIANAADQAKVKAIAEDIQNWKDTTPKGMDILKRRIASYYEPGSQIGAFSEGLRSTARQLINDTPGYTEAMKNYSEVSDQIADVKQALSLGDKAAVETTINKLKGALKSNNGFRKQVLEELDEATGGKLKQAIAGVNMSSITPKGLAKYADIAGGATALSHGVGILPILGAAITTSPRVVGEFVNALGIGTRGSKAIMGILNKVATPIVVTGAAASKKTTPSSQ